ncbi:MAG TPA: hypothetical protein PKD37_04565 [Oligoflexia bacterium]|nr:hypothetical protein [Oligoflexia bacterium]HMP27237.1 hypothetical protein [Oligoflexia bacterium]
MSSWKIFLIRLVTFLAGLYFFLLFITPEPIFKASPWSEAHSKISYGFVAVGVMALGIGLINIFWIHGSKVVFKRSGWFNSLSLISGLLVMLVVATVDWIGGREINNFGRHSAMLSAFAIDIVENKKNQLVLPEERLRIFKISVSEHLRERSLAANDVLSKIGSQDHFKATSIAVDISTVAADLASQIDKISLADFDQVKIFAAKLSELSALELSLKRIEVKGRLPQKIYGLLYDGLFVALGSAMFSLLAAYIAAAAFRAFRIKSWEAALMMFAALIVMLGQIPFGVYINKNLPALRFWLMQVPNSAAFKAINIGALVASLVIGFRVWLSLESSSFYRKKEK